MRFLRFFKPRFFCTNYLAEISELMPSEVKVDSTKHVLIVMAHGSEEMSCTLMLEILTYAGIKVTVAGLLGYESLRCSHRIQIKPTTSLDNAVSLGQKYQAIYIPGAFNGIEQMCSSKLIGDVLKSQFNKHRIVAFSSFACLTLAFHDVARGYRISTHPLVEQVIGKHFQVIKHTPMVVDANLISIRDPSNSVRLAFQLIQTLISPETAKSVADRLFYKIKSSSTEYGDVIGMPARTFPLRSDLKAWNEAFENNLKTGVDRIVKFSNSLVIEPTTIIIESPVEKVEKVPRRQLEAEVSYPDDQTATTQPGFLTLEELDRLLEDEKHPIQPVKKEVETVMTKKRERARLSKRLFTEKQKQLSKLRESDEKNKSEEIKNVAKQKTPTIVDGQDIKPQKGEDDKKNNDSKNGGEGPIGSKTNVLMTHTKGFDDGFMKIDVLAVRNQNGDQIFDIIFTYDEDLFRLSSSSMEENDIVKKHADIRKWMNNYVESLLQEK